MGTFDFLRRIDNLRHKMTEQGVDVTLLSVGADLRYFTGYETLPSERLTVLVMPKTGGPILFVPQLEAPRVQQGDFELAAWGETDDPVALAAKLGGSPRSVAVGDQMWSRFLVQFQRHWPHAVWVSASDLTKELRMRKDSQEIETLARAAHGVDRVMARIGEEIEFAGRTERDVARELAAMTIEEGHDVAEFAIVGSGPNSASPHHEAGDREIRHGDLVVCDFGGRWGGYYSDSTRTFVVGEATAEQAEVHSVVLAANEAGRAAVKEGVQCLDVDTAARAVIDDAGYGQYFIHRTGHGIGLEVHEHPYLVAGNDLLLESGMSFSIEPGIYLPGRFGVRIEDIVVCGPDGAQELNQADRSLIRVS